MPRIAREIFTETLQQLEVGAVLRRKVQRQGSHLLIGEARYDLEAFRRVCVIAIGKAAVPMSKALVEVLDPALTARHVLNGIVVGTELPATTDPRVTYRLGSHPLPDRRSFEAARLILALLEESTRDTLVFFLISGGASAMVELPLREEISLDEHILFYRALLHSGLPIAEMNTLRKHLSAVKGGRLAVAAEPAPQCTLLVSDVSPGQPDIIGSGPSLPDPSTLQACRELIARPWAQEDLPPAIRHALMSGSLPETPKLSHPAFARASTHNLLSSDDLCETAQALARKRGMRTFVDLACDEWDYRDAARYLLERLRSLSLEGSPVCLLSAGELSVPIGGQPGQGGRNQQFVLECARQIDGSQGETVVFSAGSDGVDGNSAAAGAIADTTTVRRARAAGFDAEEALARFDTFPLFHALGDTVITGPSGNNVRDLRLLLHFS